MGDILMKTRLLTLLATLVSAVSFGAPLWVDTPNNTVTFPGTIVSEQIHMDYAQLAIEPDIVQLVSNSITAWTTSSTTVAYRDIVALDNGIVVALGDDKSFRISYDHGLTFTTRAAPINFDYIGDPGIVSDADGTIYFACDSNALALVFSSTDFGSTWSQKFVSTNYGTHFGPSLACSERGDLVIISGMTNAVVTNLYMAVSHDKGTTWSYIYNTWSTQPYVTQPNAMYMTYAGNGVFVGCGSYAASNKFSEIFRSTDYGTTWSCNRTNIGTAADDIGWIRAGRNGRVAYQSRNNKVIYVSKDYGVTWPISIGKDNWASCVPLNLYGSHWLYTKGGYLIYTKDDFVTDYNIVQLGSAALGSDYSMKQNKDAIYFGEKFGGSSSYALFSLRKNSNANKTPLAVPVISTTPIAYNGALYTDGVTYYRCTNGTTWTAF